MTVEQHATLYRSSKCLLAYPSNQTVDGFCLAAPPFMRLDEEPMEVGAALRQALSEYRSGVPAPKRDGFTAISAARFEAAGVRSEAAFMHGARLVSVSMREALVLVPHRNGGASGDSKGFSALPGKQIVVPSTADDLTLGQAGLEALRQCE